MVEIRENQILEVRNLLSFHGKVKGQELQTICQEMENVAKLAGAKKVANPITATFAMHEGQIEVEALLPIDKEIEDTDKFQYKSMIRITNAIVAVHKGSPENLQNSCNELNQYMITHKLVPITVGYNVTKHIDPSNIDNTLIEVYVGINPNIV